MTATAADKFSLKAFRWYIFGVIILIAVMLGFLIKGFVLGGFFTGVLSTIVVWVLVLKFPERIRDFMGRHQLLSDVVLTGISASVLAIIGPGITLFVAVCTQAALTSLLLMTLR